MVLELRSLPVQKTEAPNPFPHLKKALSEPPGNAGMKVIVTIYFPHSCYSECESTCWYDPGIQSSGGRLKEADAVSRIISFFWGLL